MRADGSPWPRISIVTPSYNQGAYIEETIRSVLLQGYPDLEYVIVDGASSDESIGIIRKYERWLTRWSSEADDGQADAIGKGLEFLSGEIFNWINSDDALLPSALEAVGEASHSQVAIAAPVLNVTGSETAFVPNLGLSPRAMIEGDHDISYHQPGVWLNRPRILETGIDERLHYAFDFDLMVRYLARYPDVAYLSKPVALFRLHERSKTGSSVQKFVDERRRIYAKLAADSSYRELRGVCSERLRSYRWWDRVDAIMKGRAPRALRAFQLVAEMMLDPKIRFSRLSLGAIRRAISS
jgi:glycosyltransferase involved in cell wall biosynthesis